MALRSRWVFGLKMAAFGGGFRYRIGMDWYWIRRHRRSKSERLLDGFYINSISNCSARARLLRSSFEENRAPVQSILEILKKIALPCGEHTDFF